MNELLGKPFDWLFVILILLFILRHTLTRYCNKKIKYINFCKFVQTQVRNIEYINPITMQEREKHKIIDRLLGLPKECEWAEFKLNFTSNEDIGQYISALSNGAALQNEQFGYLVFGIDDSTLLPVGTTFLLRKHKKGNAELEHWLLQRLSPRIEVNFFETTYHGKLISFFQIQSAQGQPTCFEHKGYIRIGSVKTALKEFPEKERRIWEKPQPIFEKRIALQMDSVDDIVSLINTQRFFELLKIPYPSSRDSVIEKLKSEKCIVLNSGVYSITNLGALMFAKDLQNFDSLKRKSIRVIQYEGKSKIKTIREKEWNSGYATEFEGLIQYIYDISPRLETIEKGFRTSIPMYPDIAIRELVANAIIHQDFVERGSGTMIEIYSDRIEISNPGLPLISPERFIDEYQSRNEDLARSMRKIGICEERGSGIDKVVFWLEFSQLPAYDVQLQEKHTKVIIYGYKKFADLDKKGRIRACYQHTCYKYITSDRMTNQSLRKRLEIEDRNAAMVSRIIKDTQEAGLIKEEDPSSTSRKFVKYIPIWA